MTAAAPSPVLDPKAIASLQARAALAGFRLDDLPDGAFIISRWDLHRELAHAAEVERFLARVEPRGTGG